MTALKQAIACAFDDAATNYDGSAIIQKAAAHALIEDAGSLNPRAILDIGCGTGLVAAHAKAKWPHAQIIGIDASYSMIEQARRKLPSVRFYQQDASDIRLSAKFDLILSSMALHWLHNPAQALRGWRKLLQPQGQIFIAVPVQGSLSEWRDLCAGVDVQDRIWSFPAQDFFGSVNGLQVRDHRIHYASAYDFCKSLKNTGSWTARPSSNAASVPKFKKILKEAPRPFVVTFKLLYLRLGIDELQEISTTISD